MSGARTLLPQSPQVTKKVSGWVGGASCDPTFACSSDSSGDTGKCPVHLLQPPACDWGIPGAGPERKCLGLGWGGGLQAEV